MTTLNALDFRWVQSFTEKELQQLFLSVGWESGKHPELLVKAMLGSDSVCSAWCEGQLVGLMNALSDGVMTAYYHYLLVDPNFQKRGIGRNLIALMQHKYAFCLRQVLISYDTALPFYQRMGFVVGENKTPVEIAAF